MATAYPQSPDEYLPKLSENLMTWDPSHGNMTNTTANSNAHSSEQHPPGQEECKDEFDPPPDGLPNTTARANMPGFMFETKYVMLNFISLIPPDLYVGHIVSSPDSLASSELSASDSLASLNNLFAAKSHALSKSQSLDTGLHKSHPKLKHIHKVKHFQQSIDSPASDDNLNYKYKVNCERTLSPDGSNIYINEANSHNLDFSDGVMSHAIDSSNNDHFSNGSPIKSSRSSLYRMVSDISSSGDFSYVSDADDEFEDNSNASSVFSSRSITCRDGFLDLRRSTPRLSTVRSESESLDEPDCNPFLLRHDLQDVPEEKETADATSVQQEQTPEEQEMRTDVQVPSNGRDSWCSRRPAADRSKLKLNIPSQPVYLSDVLISLQTEVNNEMGELETEYEEAVRSARENMGHRCTTPLTPQTDAARILARIGDEVKAQYGQQISSAVNKYFLRRAGRMSYNVFKEIAQEVVDVTLPGWRQVALLLVFGQRVVWGSIKHGNKQVEDIVQYCSQLVADVAAEFIIKEGGWGSVMNSDPSLSSESLTSTTDADSPPCVLEYFAGHDVTQIESKEAVTGEVDENNPETTDNEISAGDDGLGRNHDAGDSMTSLDTIQLHEIHKDRLRSFGFDVRDGIDSDSKLDSADQSLDYINIDEIEKAEDGKMSANNSDIFTDDTEETTSAIENDGRTSEETVTVDWYQSADMNNYERKIPEGEVYAKESVYVKQDTPTPLKSDKNIDNESHVHQERCTSKLKNEKTSSLHEKSQARLTDRVEENHDIDQSQLNTQDDISYGHEDNITLVIPDEAATENSVTDTPVENIQTPNLDTEALKSDSDKLVDENGPIDDTDRDIWSNFGRMNVKVMIATLAVLAVGVSVRIATLNR